MTLGFRTVTHLPADYTQSGTPASRLYMFRYTYQKIDKIRYISQQTTHVQLHLPADYTHSVTPTHRLHKFRYTYQQNTYIQLHLLTDYTNSGTPTSTLLSLSMASWVK